MDARVQEPRGKLGMVVRWLLGQMGRRGEGSTGATRAGPQGTGNGLSPPRRNVCASFTKQQTTHCGTVILSERFGNMRAKTEALSRRREKQQSTNKHNKTEF